MTNHYPLFNPFETAITPEYIALPEHLIDGVMTKTNLPDGVDLFDPSSAGEHPYNRLLLPSAMDTIDIGEYLVAMPDAEESYFDRKIIVTEDENGKYVEGMHSGLTSNIGGSQKLMKALGYKYDGSYGAAYATPTPETLSRHASKLGIEVQCFSEQGLIASNDYLQAFSEGKYPVATGDARYYAHDTQDDHITAMVLGGEPLKETLKNVASEALRDNVDLDEYSMAIDHFTASLRGAISPTYNDQYDAFLEQFTDIGRGLGVSQEVMNEILFTAKDKAVEYGMELND